METIFIALRALCYMVAFILFFGWLATRIEDGDQNLRVELPAWMRAVGLFIMAGGGSLVLACAAVFITRGRGTPGVFDPPRQFVAAGPYKFVRNPMYIGGVMLLAGFGLYERSFAILLFAVAMFALFHLFVLFVEEPGLRRFGESYLAYQHSVNRWIARFG